MNEREVYILIRMRYWRLYDEPLVFGTFKEALEAFEDYTGHSWEDALDLSEELGGDLDELLGGPSAGTRILTVEIPSDLTVQGAA